MICLTVSFRSCFCWLYRDSPSLSAKHIINLISLLTIWWPCVESLCRIISCVVGSGHLPWPAYFLDKILLIFILLYFVFQSPMMKKDTPVLLPWEPHEQYEKAKRYDTGKWAPPGQKVSNMLLEKSRWHLLITPDRMMQLGQSKNNTQLWICLMVKVKSDAIKNNIV